MLSQGAPLVALAAEGARLEVLPAEGAVHGARDGDQECGRQPEQELQRPPPPGPAPWPGERSQVDSWTMAFGGGLGSGHEQVDLSA